jgi:hypothetical protein
LKLLITSAATTVSTTTRECFRDEAFVGEE